VSTYADTEEREDRIHDLKLQMGAELNALNGVACDPWRLREDLHVTGPLSVIIEWAQDWRSEIEELG